ncbi:hypothetical protein ACTGZQ_00810 [Streptococcus suis]
MMGKKKKWLILGGVIALIILLIGGFMVKQKMDAEAKAEELRRNREYEVSLVNALKNSYSDIEEIKISNPKYTEKPGNWSCAIQLTFKDEQTIMYNISHSLGQERNGSAIADAETNKVLNRHIGVTRTSVNISYSDDSKGVQ